MSPDTQEPIDFHMHDIEEPPPPVVAPVRLFMQIPDSRGKPCMYEVFPVEVEGTDVKKAWQLTKLLIKKKGEWVESLDRSSYVVSTHGGRPRCDCANFTFVKEYGGGACKHCAACREKGLL